MVLCCMTTRFVYVGKLLTFEIIVNEERKKKVVLKDFHSN